MTVGTYGRRLISTSSSVRFSTRSRKVATIPSQSQATDDLKALAVACLPRKLVLGESAM
jgi:hypothetical protein